MATHVDVPISRQQPLLLNRIKQDVHEARTCTDTAYRLCRTRATEMLAVMISDTDREYNATGLQSIPIAYGLKGYSLPTETLREMLHHVLAETFRRGLYVPICSFDGQWYKLNVRDSIGKPLTVLQLQKDVYTEVKRMTKGTILKFFSEMNIVKVTNYEELDREVDVNLENGKIFV